MLTLYVLRHAVAVERGTEGFEDDSQRPLTAKGTRKLRRIADGLQELKLSFDLVLTSPCVRARQTAEIVARAFQVRNQLKISPHLTPDGEPEDLIHDLRRLYHRPKSVLIVGHEPYLGRLITTLLVGKPAFRLTLKKGGLCKLSVDSLHFGRCATLEWLLTPRQIAAFR